jgi:hypothetical protein
VRPAFEDNGHQLISLFFFPSFDQEIKKLKQTYTGQHSDFSINQSVKMGVAR